MNILKKIISNYDTYKASRRYNLTTALNPQHNDMYVVDFPKSGITWLSTLLANMALASSNRNEYATISSVRWFVPDIHVTRNIGEATYDTPPVRFIKSHSEFNPNYLVLIYLVRNPLDVMKSFYRFKKGLQHDVGSFDAFVRSKRHGVLAWKKHINSWLVGPVISKRLYLIKYEDLIKEPASELKLISKIFGWNIDDSFIDTAVERSTVQVMKNSEELYRERNPRHTLTFVRNKEEIEISQKTIDYINSECAEEMKLLGYA